MKENANIVSINTYKEGNFFNLWLEFLKLYHNLTPRDLSVAAALLRERFKLSKSILDDEILDQVTLSQSTESRIIEECGITTSHYKVILSKLRKQGIIIDGRFNKKFLPKLNKDAKEFTLMFHFKFKDVD